MLPPVGLSQMQHISGCLELRDICRLVCGVPTRSTISTTGFAARPGTDVEPTWCTPTAREPSAVRMRISSRANCSTHAGSYSANLIGPSARTIGVTYSGCGTSTICLIRASGLAELDAQNDEDNAPDDGPDADDPDDADQAGAGPDEHQDTEQDC